MFSFITALIASTSVVNSITITVPQGHHSMTIPWPKIPTNIWPPHAATSSSWINPPEMAIEERGKYHQTTEQQQQFQEQHQSQEQHFDGDSVQQQRQEQKQEQHKSHKPEKEHQKPKYEPKKGKADCDDKTHKSSGKYKQKHHEKKHAYERGLKKIDKTSTKEKNVEKSTTTPCSTQRPSTHRPVSIHTKEKTSTDCEEKSTFKPTGTQKSKETGKKPHEGSSGKSHKGHH
ncbi:hypothetical_protein [Candidozyma auris]|uniref:hypothetical_protein n=1 Tax=Candidozyma auris TaxID=498019 RepID=UPI000D2BCE70|nr:hypothetical_protein [[Candida] auris]QEO23368.1 hypothetical_protein [[Candida] auris]GBL52943.1 hypothetical protein CAJCM15448_52170 [[Candida] auris]